LSLIAGGIAIRVYDLGYPRELVFDEHHCVKNARNYLAARSDSNDHERAAFHRRSPRWR
jgi:dolichyl-phosphate-mannose--protein O-mannosyl transferase